MRINVVTDDPNYGDTVPVGTQWRVPAQKGVTVFEYIGEAYFDYNEPTLDGDYEWLIVMSGTDDHMGTLDEFVATYRNGNSMLGYPTLRDAGIDAVRFDYINGGVAIQMTSDEEGCYMFRFWGEDA